MFCEDNSERTCDTIAGISNAVTVQGLDLSKGYNCDVIKCVTIVVVKEKLSDVVCCASET